MNIFVYILFYSPIEIGQLPTVISVYRHVENVTDLPYK